VISLKKIVIQNFRSFSGRQELELPENGLFVIKGSNADTGGESGAGKTSIMLAISYALGFCPFPGKDLENWFSEPMQIELSLIVDGKSMVIHKGQINKIEWDGTEIAGAKQIEECLQSIFMLNQEQRYVALYKSQGDASFFLNKTNADKKDFLCTILGLNEFEREIDETSVSILAADDKLADIQATYDGALTAAKNSLNKLNSIEIPDNKDIEDKIGKIDALIALNTIDLNMVAEELGQLRVKHIERLKEQEAAASLVKLDLAKVSQHEDLIAIVNDISCLQDEVRDISLALTGCLKNIDEAVSQKNAALMQKQKDAELTKEIAKLEALVPLLKQGKCPTCEQEWAAKAKLEKVVSEITEKQNLLKSHAVVDMTVYDDALTAHHAKREELNDEKNKWLQKATLLNKKKEETSALLSRELLAKLYAIQNEKSVFADLIDHSLKETQRLNRIASALMADKNKAIIENQSIANKVSQAVALKDFLEKDIQAWSVKEASANKGIGEVKSNLDYLNDKLDFTKAFLSNILADILGELSLEANSILAQVPNVSHVTLAFESERVTQKGSVRQEICAKTYINGTDRPLKTGCSGGMIVAVQLAVDLALRKVLARRTGRTWGLLMVDEQFGGLDLVSKASCMQVLKFFSQDCLVMVVDHHTELNESADKCIEVLYENGTSTIA
jgi:DNA repair exonuclease SbcCD ATPase subunit